MALVETEALVLRTYNLAEADKIVVCLSRVNGLVRGVAKGCRRLRNRFGAALEPFTHINLTYYQKENQELVAIRQAEILMSSFNIVSDPVTLSGLAYMGDLIVDFSPPYQANENLFRMVKACLDATANAPEDLDSVLRYFEIWLLRLEGFLPDLKRCADCHRAFEEREPVYIGLEPALRCRECSTAARSQLLSAAVHQQLLTIMKLPPGSFATESRTVSGKINRELSQLTQRMIMRVVERQPRTRPSYAPAGLDSRV